MRRFCLALALSLPFALASAACSSNDAGDGGGCKVGANAAYANPAGTPFALPAGVEQVGEITGDFSTPECETAEDVEYGGDLLPACVGLKNTTGAEIVVKIPAGLFFISEDPEVQNGIILQDHDLTIPAGATKYFRFDLFCANKNCIFGSKASRFTFGNVTNDPLLRELVDLAKNKVLRRSTGSKTAYVFGQAIWDVTEGLGLSAERKKELADVTG
ncbi:MAG: hypothetical protein KF819_25240 [Labilithrix sp.]|nr:hypothetical protein [Labilithrix sp.]